MIGRCRVVVLAKAPVAGFAKTRLIPALGADGAAALAARLLEHAVREARAAALGTVELCCAPDASHAAFRALARLAQLSEQGAGDLGRRMTRAFERAFGAGERRVLLIGSDAPALDAGVLREAARQLAFSDAVFVPTLDGGYALVGLRQKNAPALFDHMAWSCASVMHETRARLAAAGLSHVELAPLADIDEPADLRHLPAGWRA